MKIVFTAGGSGGHFYPLIAIAEAVRESATEQRIMPPKLYYLADKPYDEAALFAQAMTFVKIPAGRSRRYFSLQNVTDLFKTAWGVVRCYFILLRIYPDVVISKGSYVSVPVTIAASLLGIPTIIHESDTKPGRANLLAAKHATRIGVAFDSAAAGFPAAVQKKIAKVGIPVRKELRTLPPRPQSQTTLNLDPALPTILVLGGSLGSMRINDTVLNALPQLLSFAQVIHQTGRDHFENVRTTMRGIVSDTALRTRYHVYPYLNAESLRQAAASADLVITRAGAGSITETSLWAIPAILIPIPEAISHDQRTNAYAYAQTGAAVVLEESNLTGNVLASESRRILSDGATHAHMRAAAAGFVNPNAARTIADEAIRIGLSHEAKNG